MRGPPQRRQEGIGHRDDAEDVRLIDAAESASIVSACALAVTGDARVVDQDVQGVDLVRGGGHARGVGDVQDEQPGAAADLLHGAFSARGIAGADVHGEAGSSELARDLLADALVGAGDQCN